MHGTGWDRSGVLAMLSASRAQYRTPQMSRAALARHVGLGGLGALGDLPLAGGVSFKNPDARRDFLEGVTAGAAGRWPGYTSIDIVAGLYTKLEELSASENGMWASSIMSKFDSDMTALAARCDELQHWDACAMGVCISRTASRESAYLTALRTLADRLNKWIAFAKSAISTAADAAVRLQAAKDAEAKRLAAIEADKQYLIDQAALEKKQREENAALEEERRVAAYKDAQAKAASDIEKAKAKAVEDGIAMAKKEAESKQSLVDQAAAKLVALTQSGASQKEIDAAKAAVRAAMGVQAGGFDLSAWSMQKKLVVGGAAAVVTLGILYLAVRR